MTAMQRTAAPARHEPPEIGQPAGALPPGMRLGQQTAIEQSRAVAEVQGAIIVAQRVPRNEHLAIEAMKEACAQFGLADRAFWRYRRGDKQVTGATVHLARELARCWGNFQYGVGELDRDDIGGYSQMLAWAWDVQTNTRASHSFINPHKRDRSEDKGGTVVLTETRDIYENNANAAARRLREQIFAVLPVWFVEDAKALCHQTLANPGDGKTRAQRVAEAIAVWQGKGITVRQLEDKLGRSAADWTDPDVAVLRVIWTSIGRGETTLTEEFAPEQVTPGEIEAQTPQAPPADPVTPPTAPTPVDDGGSEWPDQQTRRPPDAKGGQR